ncbi:MAG: DUF427 domain-containing protein [Actinomycetota bacterium]|nr:DUF427 domain-containing protein [Actinomycetota bacterium]
MTGGGPTRRVEPGPGQESVWDYPRPPSIQRTARHIVVTVGGQIVADTTRAWRVCETSHPPVYYVPREDIAADVLDPGRGSSYCEFKGLATYWSVRVGARFEPEVGWSYEKSSPAYERLAGAVAFYPGRVDDASIDGERVRAQAGGFYGGWITDGVVGPFKGEPGTSGW